MNDSCHLLISTTMCTLPSTQASYLVFRVYFLWSSFSGWHIAGLAYTWTVYVVCMGLFFASAKPKYDEKQTDKLVYGGTALDESGGVLEYTWDMLYETIFLQLATGFVSDWWWLVHLIPPNVAFYFLWIKVIYPWISRPDPDPVNPMMQQGVKGQKVKYGKAT